jgi:hypothetical protein
MNVRAPFARRNRGAASATARSNASAVVGAAQLERPGPLEVLQLEPDVVVAGQARRLAYHRTSLPTAASISGFRSVRTIVTFLQSATLLWRVYDRRATFS